MSNIYQHIYNCMVPIIQIEIPNCPYNSKQLTFLVKAVRERVGLRSIIYPPRHPHLCVCQNNSKRNINIIKHI